MRYRNPKQNSIFHMLITELGIDAEAKAEMVYDYTDGRTSSSSEMSEHEMQILINFLKVQKHTDTNIADRKRKRVISQMIQAGYVNNGKADMKAIESWGLKVFKKPFNSLSIKELSKVITAAENVKKHYLSKL